MPKTFLPTNIGFIISDLREKKKLRAIDLANGINLGKSNVHAIENIRTNPSLHTLMKILDFFGFELQIVRKKDKKLHSTIKFISKV